jgi:hypothetical protein
MSKIEFVVKENNAFRLKLCKWKATNPKDLNALEFVQECLDKEGNVEFSSTYQYNLTNDELKQLSVIVNKLLERS